MMIKDNTKLFKTANALSEETRSNVIGILQARLFDAIDLMLQTKQAHWNVKGPQFATLHELFDTFHSEAENYADLLAERISQLGGVAEGTSKMVVAGSQLSEYPNSILDGKWHLEYLETVFAIFERATIRDIQTVEALGDSVSADLLINIGRGVDKSLWYVENYLHDSRSERVKLKKAANA